MGCTHRGQEGASGLDEDGCAVVVRVLACQARHTDKLCFEALAVSLGLGQVICEDGLNSLRAYAHGWPQIVQREGGGRARTCPFADFDSAMPSLPEMVNELSSM
jgi:hypothetical protein